MRGTREPDTSESGQAAPRTLTRSDPIAAAECTILDELLDAYPAQLTEPELARVVGDELNAHDALLALYGAGLVHRSGDFWWASRPVACLIELGYGR